MGKEKDEKAKGKQDEDLEEEEDQSEEDSGEDGDDDEDLEDSELEDEDEDDDEDDSEDSKEDADLDEIDALFDDEDDEDDEDDSRSRSTGSKDIDLESLSDKILEKLESKIGSSKSSKKKSKKDEDSEEDEDEEDVVTKKDLKAFAKSLIDQQDKREREKEEKARARAREDQEIRVAKQEVTARFEDLYKSLDKAGIDVKQGSSADKLITKNFGFLRDRYLLRAANKGRNYLNKKEVRLLVRDVWKETKDQLDVKKKATSERRSSAKSSTSISSKGKSVKSNVVEKDQIQKNNKRIAIKEKKGTLRPSDLLINDNLIFGLN